MNAEDFVEVDADLDTFDVPNEEEIVSSVLKDEGIASETIITELEEEEEDQELPLITRDEGYRAYNNF